MKTLGLACVVCLVSSVAVADTVTVQPKVVRPGDAVLVTVTGARRAPSGTAEQEPLQFARVKNGYQALFAVPLEEAPDRIAIDVNGEERTVAVRDVVFPESDVVVEEEYANPPADARARIAEDNKAILAAMRHDGGPQFTATFRRPRGEVTSRFGEWRTFNDGHRSQHLGFDVFAREGTKVRAINTGTVALVRDTYLAGNVVVIAHGNGIASAYFHLADSEVTEGDVVREGDVIGRAGQTGRTTGPHLHLAVRVPGGFVDPASFFKLRIAPAEPVYARRAIRRAR